MNVLGMGAVFPSYNLSQLILPSCIWFLMMPSTHMLFKGPSTSLLSATLNSYMCICLLHLSPKDPFPTAYSVSPLDFFQPLPQIQLIPTVPNEHLLSQETILTIVAFTFDSLRVNPPRTSLATGREAPLLPSHVCCWHECLGLVSATGRAVSWGPCCREVSSSTLSSAHSAAGERWLSSIAGPRADGVEGPYGQFLLLPFWRVSFSVLFLQTFSSLIE